MKKNKFREETPKRTCTKQYKSYRSYKKYLRDDFNEKCGYCDDSDRLVGGRRVYHIDHFAPHSKFKEKLTDYDNLIYSCSYCNLAKSDDWISDSPDVSVLNNEGYIDPCSASYDEQFSRDSNGNICPETEIGRYMYENMNLFLKRHSLIWSLERLKGLIDEVDIKIENNENSELLSLYRELSKQYFSMFDELTEEA